MTPLTDVWPFISFLQKAYKIVCNIEMIQNDFLSSKSATFLKRAAKLALSACASTLFADIFFAKFLPAHSESVSEPYVRN